MPPELLVDDFSSYPPGIATIPYYGLRRIGPWETRNIDYLWDLGPGAPGIQPYDIQSQVWGIELREGRKLLAHAGESFAVYLRAGEDMWHDYDFEAEFAWEKRTRTLGSSFGCDHDQERMLSGLLARYQTQRCHYFWGADGDGHPLLAKRIEEELVPLFRSRQMVSAGDFHRWKIRLRGHRLRAYLDDHLLAEARDSEWACGAVGFRTDRPLRVRRVLVTCPSSEISLITQRRAAFTRARRSAAARLRRPIVCAVLERRSFWHQLAVADVNGDGSAELVHASLPEKNPTADWQPCLELLDLGGKVVWRTGDWPKEGATPGQDPPCRGSGTVLHIAQADEDGETRIVLGYRNRIEVYAARDGRRIAAAELPPYTGLDGSVQAMEGFDITPAHLLPGAQRQWLVMNGQRLLALDQDLRPLWSHLGNLGHKPTSGDLDGDGLDEVMSGYSLLDARGKIRWSVPGLETRINSDMIDAHNDQAVFGRFHPDDPTRIAMAASQKGFYLLECDGRIVARQKLGHIQEVWPGRFLKGNRETQFLTSTLWETAGIFWRLDARGQPMRRWEFGVFTPMLPMRWPGHDENLLLLTDFDRRPAIMDGEGRILWQADVRRFELWRRLPKQGVQRFRAREIAQDVFFANYGRHLVIYGNDQALVG